MTNHCFAGGKSAGLIFLSSMSNNIPDQDITRSLARAFDRAWDRYYHSGQLTLSRDVARIELAQRLVQLSKEGIRDEITLSRTG